MTEDESTDSSDTLPAPWHSVEPCLICEEKATKQSPTIDRPWIDKLPVIKWLRKLYNAPTRHTVVMRGPKTLCTMHFGLAEQMADNEVAERRHTQALLNGREALKVHEFNRGLIDALTSLEREYER